MDDNQGYAVFFFPQALEALGDAIKPYLQEGAGGPHMLCREIDTGGSLIEMTLGAHTKDGEVVQMELMVPTSMVRMIVSARTDDTFGFGPRPITPVSSLPVVAAAPDGSKPVTKPAAVKKKAADSGQTPAGKKVSVKKVPAKKAPVKKKASRKTKAAKK